MAKVEQILVTPKIAEVLLGGNINNRWEAHSRNTVVLTHICERAIYDFAHQIERGKAYGESVGARGIYSKSLTWASLYNGELSL